MCSIADAQESRGLLEGAGAEAGHGGQRSAIAKGTVRGPVLDDCAGDLVTQPGDVGQQLRAGGIELDSDGIDRALNGIGKAGRQGTGVDVVLVLADANRLRVELGELGQRVL